MKYLFTLCLVVSVVLLTQCKMMHKHKKDPATAKESPKKKNGILNPADQEEYIVPPNVQPEMVPAFTERCNKGKMLYDINCASCHGIFTAGKDGVPNFTQKQFDKYSTQYVLRDQVNHAVAFKMNPEDLAFVMDYLRYRKSANPAENVIPPDPR